MEEEKQLAGEDRLSGEIVEVYRQPLPGEVVERYSRPLPGRPAAPGQPRRRRRTGLWIFLACLAVVLGVAAGSWIWYLLPAGSSADRPGQLPSPPIRSGRAPCWRWRRTTAGS